MFYSFSEQGTIEKTTVMLSPQSETLDQLVSDTFDEFQRITQAVNRFHPSEEVNRQFKSYESSCVTFDIINSYHVYCKLCFQHFYSESAINDINSFFQKHINTSLHKSWRFVSSLSDDKPIMEWEKLFHTGRCNICNMSGIPAFVIHSVSSLEKVEKLHVCYYTKQLREVNPIYLKKNKNIRKFATLNIFLEKLLEVRDDTHVVCLLCQKWISGKKEDMHYHLATDEHFINFCDFAWSTFQFQEKDLLNGFNLEFIIRWIAEKNLVLPNKDLRQCNDVAECIANSSSEVNLYTNIQSNAGFSPKHIESILKPQNSDFVSENTCLLCGQKNVKLLHISGHLVKCSITFKSFENQQTYSIFKKNREDRLSPHVVPRKMYTKLNNELKQFGLKIGIQMGDEITNSNFENFVAANSDFLMNTLLNRTAITEMDDDFLPKEESLQENEKNGAKNNFDFTCLRHTLTNLMDVFGNEIIENVKEKSFRKESKPESEKSQPDEPCEKNTPEKTAENTNSENKKAPETAEKNDKEVATSDSKNETPEENTEEKDENSDAEHEALVIKDVPKSQQNKYQISEIFYKYGKIRYVFIQNDTIFLAFYKDGIAEKLLNGKPIFLNGNKLNLTLTKRKIEVIKKPTQPYYNPEMMLLLEDYNKLLKFALALWSQAMVISRSFEERLREQYLCQDILNAIAITYPHSRCYVFGSRCSGLALGGSDVDVFLDLGSLMFEGVNFTGVVSEKQIIYNVEKALTSHGYIHKKVVERARVPIISFIHRPTRLHCDLSFKNGLGIQNSLLLKLIISLDWRVGPIILFLKHWANANLIHGPSFFSSYGLSLLAIFYLMQACPPVLPKIEVLQKSFVGRRISIIGWDCNVCTDIKALPKTENMDPIPILLLGFFKYYAEFDYTKYVICPLVGEPVPREAFMGSTEVQLPMSLKRHIHNLSGPPSSLVRTQILMCLIDPFDLSHNLTKNLCKTSLELFVSICQLSASQLYKAINVSASNVSKVPPKVTIQNPKTTT